MTLMGDHARSAAAGRVPRRAMFSAWAVFLSMAGTTMTFQVYHSIRVGQMPWELAVLEGVIPLAISIGVLEYVAEWEDKPRWASPAAYLITAGSMFLSAVATGSVVVHAAPPHMSGLFGILLDGAALLSIRFILTAPRSAREKAAAEARQQAEAERAEAGQVATLARALEVEQAAHLRSVSDLRAEIDRRVQALIDQHDGAVTDLREQLDGALSDHGIAQQKALDQEARANLLDRQLTVARADRKQRAASHKDSSAGSGTPARNAEDVSTELLALMALREDPTLCQPRQGGRLARKLEVSAATGGRLHRKLTSDGSLNESVARSLMEATGE